MRILNRSRLNRGAVGVVVVVAVLLVGAGQALAHSGSGESDGYEIPPETVNFTNQTTMCAEFVASSSDPLIHELDMVGDFHGETGSGSATFTRTSPYYANPEGTYADEDCLTQASVSGSMTIEFEQWDCSGSGTYERRNSGEYSLAFSGTCDDTTTQTSESISTAADFTGTQTVCPDSDCGPGYPQDSTSLIAGTYTQTG